MPAPHYADLPTAARHYIDAASWNAIKTRLDALGQTGLPAFTSLPSTTKPYIDQPNFDALSDAISGAGIEGTATLDFPSIPSGDSWPLTFAAAGAVAGRMALVGPPVGWDPNLSFCAYASDDDEITVIVANTKSSGEEINPPSGSWTWITF